MASDLSELIQTGLNGTLESLLAKRTVLGQTTKAHPTELNGQFIKVDTVFEFQNITSNWSFLIPSLSASHIFNLMMGEDIEPIDEIDEDTLDAINEVVSNISGGLTTAINAAAFDDLGTVKFSVPTNEIVQGDEYSTLDTIFRIPISLDDREVFFFINFDEQILPFIDNILKSKVTQVMETKATIDAEEEQNNATNDELTVEPEDVIENNLEEKDNNSSEDTVQENKTSKEDEKEVTEEEIIQEKKSKLDILKKLNILKVDENLPEDEQKQAKLKKIIILIGGLLGFTIILAIILYFIGAFDPQVVEPTEDELLNKPVKVKTIEIKAIERKKYIDFNISQINPKRLNKKLQFLSKYEILENDIQEQEKSKEKVIQQKQQQKLEEFKNNNKEESLTNRTTKDAISKPANTNLSSFIKIPTLKLNNFKSFIKKAKLIKANLSICKDTNGRTQIFIGPFDNNTSRQKLLTTLTKDQIKDTTNLDLSKEEFNQKCSF